MFRFLSMSWVKTMHLSSQLWSSLWKRWRHIWERMSSSMLVSRVAIVKNLSWKILFFRGHISKEFLKKMNVLNLIYKKRKFFKRRSLHWNIFNIHMRAFYISISILHRVQHLFTVTAFFSYLVSLVDNTCFLWSNGISYAWRLKLFIFLTNSVFFFTGSSLLLVKENVLVLFCPKRTGIIVSSYIL